MRVRVAYALALASALCVLSGASLHAQGSPVSYIYDALGRLVSVVDGTGESAVYVYDGVGNLLSIERHTAGTVAVLQFSPQSGPISATVTISGTGFSATSNQNSLTFNGVSATVTTATTTQLVATVPAGATTGTIAVTTPSGSASSGSAFTVTSGNAPTITSFTPSIGVAGTAVTITGTNFQTTPTNDRTMFNLRHAAVTSSTSSTISTTVPSLTGSGRISVYTPVGGAVGDDFFVPPTPYTAADVAVTTRWNVNQSSNMSISTASKIGLAVFDSTAGHRLSLRGTNSTFTGTLGCDIFVNVLKPDGTVLLPADCMEGSGFLDAGTMAISGTYTIVVDPYGTATGSLTLTPYDFVDVTGSITPGGSAVTTTTTSPGQNAKLGFSGTTGQRVSLLGTNGITGQTLGCDVFTSILKPDGNAIGAATCMEGSGFMDPVTLPSNGAYRLLMDPASTATGALTLALYDVPADISGSITPGGSPVTVTTTTAGQNAILTFSGTINQRVFLSGTNGISGQIGITCDVTATIRKPDGSALGSVCMEGSGIIDTLTLPTSGTYTIFVDPAAWAVGSLTLTLSSVPADITGSITPGGSSVTVTTTGPGQNASLTFTGTANQRVFLLGTNGITGQGGINCDVSAAIRKPDGSQLASACMESSGFIDVQTLPTSGTYTIFVDPWGYAVGSLTLTLYNVPADVSGTLTVGGAAVPVTITSPGQNGSLTFSSSGTQQVTVHVTGNTVGWVTIRLIRPDQSVQAATLQNGASFNLSTQTIGSGTYKVQVDPSGAGTGTTNISVTSP